MKKVELRRQAGGYPGGCPAGLDGSKRTGSSPRTWTLKNFLRGVMMFRNTPEKVDSFIRAESDFQGEFVAKETLMIASRVDRMVKADCVIVREIAVINGEVTAAK